MADFEVPSHIEIIDNSNAEEKADENGGMFDD